MPSTIRLRHTPVDGDSDGDLLFRFENTLGSPIVGTPTWLDNGQAVADSYVVTATVSGGVTLAIVCGSDSKNPYQGTGIAVVADGVTPNYNIVPGVGIVLSASIATGNEFKVAIGCAMTSAGAITDVMNVGVVQAGNSSTAQAISAVNVGSATSVQTSIASLPSFYWNNGSRGGGRTFIDEIDNHTAENREKTAVAGSYELTWQNWADGTGGKAGYKVADLYVKAPGDSVPELAAVAVPFDGESRIQHGHADYDDTEDKLQGLGYIPALTTSDPTSETVYLEVLDGHDWWEFAEDSTGSPGTFSTDDLELTQSGQAAGTILTSQKALFHQQWSPPEGTEPSAMRLMRPSVRGLTV
ncbi:MAG: hypothetical protein GY906_11650 [bacterium]|nr:hypothetical protein [bacterium]